MAKNVEGTLFERITGQLFEIGRQLRQRKGYPYNPEQLKLYLQAAIEGRFNVDQQPSIEAYTVTVSYTGKKTIKNLLKEGRYMWVNENITDRNFPAHETGTEEKEICLVHFDRWFDNGDQVIEELDRLGYRLADPAQLLALGAQYPDLQRQFPIAALGQHWVDFDGLCSFVCLFGISSMRPVDLGLLEKKWRNYWRFAVLRK